MYLGGTRVGTRTSAHFAALFRHCWISSESVHHSAKVRSLSTTLTPPGAARNTRWSLDALLSVTTAPSMSNTLSSTRRTHRLRCFSLRLYIIGFRAQKYRLA